MPPLAFDAPHPELPHMASIPSPVPADTPMKRALRQGERPRAAPLALPGREGPAPCCRGLVERAQRVRRSRWPIFHVKLKRFLSSPRRQTPMWQSWADRRPLVAHLGEGDGRLPGTVILAAWHDQPRMRRRW